MPSDQRYGIDVWAVGCSLYELFTGQFLFEGASNNEVLKLMMETRGRFSIKMLNIMTNISTKSPTFCMNTMTPTPKLIRPKKCRFLLLPIEIC